MLLGVVLFPFIDLSTVVIASVILDIEPIVVILFGLPSPLHGFFHSYLGATLVAIVLSLVVWPMRKPLNSIVSLFGLNQESSLRHIVPASFIGVYFHVFLDSFIYPEMNPFYPLIGNPFIGVLPVTFVYSSCVYIGLLGLGVLSLRILYVHFQQSKIQPEPDVFSSI